MLSNTKKTVTVVMCILSFKSSDDSSKNSNTDKSYGVVSKFYPA